MGYIERLTRSYYSIKPRPNRKLEQYEIDLASIYRKYQEIRSVMPTGDGLLVGDDDLLSLFLSCHQYRLEVLECDQRVVDVIEKHAARDAEIRFLSFDLQKIYDGVYPSFAREQDFFVTAPPYTPEGMMIFSAVGVTALKVGGLGFISTPHEPGTKADTVSIILMKFLLENGCICDKVIPAMTIEEGLPAYLVVARKVKEIESISWSRGLERKMYEWEEYGATDAFAHQIK